MSSFQLWDLTKSPHIAVVGIIEPDHLNVHKDFNEYTSAKANIARWQTENDYLIYYSNNPDSKRIAREGNAIKIPYPFEVPKDILDSITLPGQHNQDNAIAAISAVASYKNISPNEYLSEYSSTVKAGLASFHGLPHRLEFLRELNNVKYYDDNFSTNIGSTRVAINAFPKNNLVVIIGGRDKTDNADLPEIYEALAGKNIKNIILIGESGHELATRYQDPRFVVSESLEEAVSTAKKHAEQYTDSIVLMSPSAASFDMFKNVYDRGGQYKKMVMNF